MTAALLYLYGPYRFDGTTAPSNEDFDRSLRSRDPRWGVRDVQILIWGIIHLAYLVGWGNRFEAVVRWMWTILARNRRERLISMISLVREETAQGFKEVKEDIRGAHVAVEGLREVVRQVAEGVDNTNEILGRYKEEVSRDLTEVESRHRLAYRNLEGRVDTLEKARKQAGN